MKPDSVLKQFLAGIQNPALKIKKIYLFGSRARGTERPDSDYDLLLIVDPQFTLHDREKLYDVVMNVLLETGKLVSLKIFKQTEFDRLSSIPTPFMSHVLDEGVVLLG